MKSLQQFFQAKPVERHQHFLFNLLAFLSFRKSDYENRFSIESHPLSPFAAIPYILFAEIYFFRQRRYFVTLTERIIGGIALQEKDDVLYISSLAVSPSYRKIGVATYMLNHAIVMARQLHKNALELSVLKANTPALKLYVKSGFRKKKERRRSFILQKDVKNI
ncbi:GNAT family N-acetyltransferase [Candidatus Bathyarchaeota archaeon]|nr:GNAT family N-acetyltransferase [Candidatus Bathyarchaeota archaeon]